MLQQNLQYNLDTKAATEHNVKVTKHLFCEGFWLPYVKIVVVWMQELVEQSCVTVDQWYQV
jgi:hypothetical protein